VKYRANNLSGVGLYNPTPKILLAWDLVSIEEGFAQYINSWELFYRGLR